MFSDWEGDRALPGPTQHENTGWCPAARIRARSVSRGLERRRKSSGAGGAGITFRSTVAEVAESSAGFPLLLFSLMHTDSYSVRKVAEEQLGLGAPGINALCHFGDGV